MLHHHGTVFHVKLPDFVTRGVKMLYEMERKREYDGEAKAI